MPETRVSPASVVAAGHFAEAKEHLDAAADYRADVATLDAAPPSEPGSIAEACRASIRDMLEQRARREAVRGAVLVAEGLAAWAVSLPKATP